MVGPPDTVRLLKDALRKKNFNIKLIQVTYMYILLFRYREHIVYTVQLGGL